MKILYLNAAGNLGGAERALLDLIASLRTARPDWTCELIAGAEGGLVAEARAVGAAASAIALPRAAAVIGDAAAGGPAGSVIAAWRIAAGLALAAPALARYTRDLAGAIARSSPDLIHANGFKMQVLGARAAAGRTPLLWHVHDYLQARPLMPMLLRAHARRCAAVIANSASVAADVRAVLGGRCKVSTVYNAIDLERFSVAGPRLDLDRLCAMPPLGTGGVRVGLVATMARWKGHATFLRAIAKVAASVPLRAYVIGGPLYETPGSQYTIAEVRACAAACGVADRVGFTGFVDDPAAAMRALDIVVHASTAPEPFGLVIAEAMACGRAVIASAGGGAAEIVTEGGDALTHRPGDADNLAEKITLLSNDAAMRMRLGTAAAAGAARRFTRERLAAEVAPIYLEAAGAAARARAAGRRSA
ncbi:MAG TPA: glycosyltransferase [Candidatus Binataceae bacterium]|nr:glycosyltransferase [Candidatus Binataceae bacterium]